MEITGTVEKILPNTSGVGKNGKPWNRATVVFKIGDQKFDKRLAVDFYNTFDEANSLSVGDSVSMQLDVTSREFNGKWFHTVSCYGLKVL